MLAPGDYRTKDGSMVTIRPGGGWVCDFDWFEEKDACFDCKVADVDIVQHLLVWQCERCNGGFAELTPIEPAQEEGLDGADDAPHTTRRAPHMERWVKITRHQFDGPPFWNVELAVESQFFLIADGLESQEQAEWHRDMLCIALDVLVRREKGEGGHP